MNDNVFRKKLNEMGKTAREKIEKFFDGATNSAHEFVEKFKSMNEKTRVKVVKSVGAALMSLLILAGFTSCDEDINNILNEGTGMAQVTTIDSSSFDETTYHPPVETTRPEETSSRPDETTQKPPVEITTPTETTTIKPVETTPPVETTVPPVETTTPPIETTTPPEETTTPGGVIVAPSEDLPADADGYDYPDFFANLVYNTVTKEKLFGYASVSKYKDTLRSQVPEIVFVERGESSKAEPSPIVIYSRYCMDESKDEYVYTRMSFSTGGNDYGRLGVPARYGSYAEYVSAVQNALQNKAELINAELSHLLESQDSINNMLGVNYAQFLGEEFIDASVNCARDIGDTANIIKELNGFVYDEDGKAYSYVLKYQFVKGVYPIDYMLELINQGKIKREDFKMLEVSYTPVAGVFQEQTNEAQ